MVMEIISVISSGGRSRFTDKGHNIFGNENVLYLGWGGGYKNV